MSTAYSSFATPRLLMADRHPPGILLVSIVLLAGVASLLCGERIQIHDGMGYDGVQFVQGAINPRQIPNISKGTSSLLHRAFPSVVVHVALRTLNAELNTRNILRGFRVLSLITVCLAAAAACGIARELKLSPAGTWLLLACLFGNFALLKMPTYYSNLTDQTAFAVALGMLLAYLRRNDWLLVLLTVIAAFTLQTACLTGLILLTFPRTSDVPATDAAQRRWGIAIGLIVTLAIFAYLISLRNWGEEHIRLPMRSNRTLLSLSFLIVIVYVYRGISELAKCSSLSPPWRLLSVLKKPRTWLVFLLAAAIIGVWRIPPTNGDLPHSVTFGRIFWESVINPAVFIVAHIIYFGPILIVMLWLWPAIARRIHECGTGVTLVAIVAVVFGLMSESRNWINFFPILAVFAVQAFDDRRYGVLGYTSLAVMTLLSSRAWVPLNDDFPARFLAFHGPFMKPHVYTWSLGVSVAMVLVIALLAKFDRPTIAGQSAELGT